MSLFPLDVPLLVPHTVQRTSSGLLSTTITTGGTPHVKSGWIQFTPNTAQDTYLVRVYMDGNNVSATDTSCLLDIGIGNLGSEVVIAANLLIGNKKPTMAAGSAQPGATTFDIPIFIPAGTRVAGRVQSAQATFANVFSMDFFGVSTMLGNPFMGAAVEDMGALTASSHGTPVVAGASNAAGSWTQIASSTSSAYRALIIGLDAAGSTAVLADNVVFDVGIGAAASEVSLLPAGYIQACTGTSETVDIRVPNNHLLWLPHSVPAGSRLSVRASQSGAGAQPVGYGAALYGVR